MGAGIDLNILDKLIADSTMSGGGERANYQLFIVGLCNALGLDPPEMSREANQYNDYVFERRLDYRHPDGSATPMFADCYRRGAFVLEAKQSARRVAIDEAQASLFPEEARQRRLGHARRGSAGWDRLMRNAYAQAVDYTRHLPVEHGYPPFVLVVDVGHVIEIYADFSGQGKNYAQFPDRQGYRITMEDLRRPEIQARLRAIWLDPHSLDPAKRSAEVTRDIAGRLSLIAKRLEGKHDARDVAEFLMRCLFTMFAEDVGLLPKASFADLLGKLADRPETFPVALEALWRTMDEGGYEPGMMATLRRFNGSLFKTRRALPLAPEDIHELYVAAKQDWSDVEPAIFGTLLERALDPRERSKLGAHYTPRAYVERLVIPTIIEPLRADWTQVQAEVADLKREGKDAEALQRARDFHHTLCTTRVLDPACGTGNFLYVALELMKKLEGEVLEALDDLGQDQGRLAMEGETVGPRQFYGLELNKRAVPIADLVLWIGYLKWQLRTVGLNQITEPVLHAYGTIKEQDAILAYDRVELLRDARGRPVTRWDGVTTKLHPITGEAVPDPEAQVEVYRYINPRPAEWPEAEFIVGNPPFIGGKDMRAELGDGYAEAAWAARPQMPGGADFVMHFWDEAARRLLRADPNPLRRFGFITTNSITQTFSRRVIERHMAAKLPLSLVYAVPDHPWMKAADKAAVRIAMTVAVRGVAEGVLAEVVKEEGLNTDTPQVELARREGKVVGRIAIGADIGQASPLLANGDVGSRGVQLMGQGFLMDATSAQSILQSAEGSVLRKYASGRDLVQRHRNKYVIDLYGISENYVETAMPQLYQRLIESVRPERRLNNRASYRSNWWLFGENSILMRDGINGISRYIATTRTSAHRLMQFLSEDVLCESKVVVLALDRGRHLATLSSKLHVWFSDSAGGWQGVGNDPVYQHTETFNPFPFPAFDTLPQALLARLDSLGERLDAFRKARLAEHPFLTMTGLYNVLERLRELDAGADVEPLTDKERDIHAAGLVSVLKEIHDEIDRAVFEAYGWSDLAAELVGKPGATTPSPHKSPAQEAAEEELLTRLVALNRERAAEEAKGQVRWLRPEYQIPRLAKTVALPSGEQIEADIVVPDGVGRPKWPNDPFEQIRQVREVLARATAPLDPNGLAQVFDGRLTDKRRARVQQVLDTLVVTGAARTGQLDGETRYFVPR